MSAVATEHEAAPERPDGPLVGRRRRWRRLALPVLAVLVFALPVPWMHVVSEDPPGVAWRLDGRLQIDGRALDPPGRWSWLTVGRPPLVAEVVRDALRPGDATTAVDLRDAPVTGRPALNEPAAAAVGLRHAGIEVPLGLLVEAREPTLPGFPEVAVIVEAHGIALSSREEYDLATNVAGLPEEGDGPADVTFVLADGRRFTAPGPWLPYARVNVLDLAPAELEAGIAGPFARLAELAPVDWFRNLNLGSSHGTMVALLAYVDASGHDLAQGRHVAGTGGIRGDGVVTRIGGLEAKARAARRAGADVLLFPSSQAADLVGFDPGAMTLVPVETLGDAIDWLARPVL